MNYITRVFISGLLILIPIILTFFISFWFINHFESLFKNLFIFIFPGNLFKKYYFPGMGTIAGIVFIFIIGFVMQSWGMMKLYEYGEKLIERSPILGDIYSTCKSLMQYFSGSDKKAIEQVVILEFQGLKVLGIVTRENFDDAPIGIGGTDIIAVYLPMSYQLGGYTIYIHRQYVKPINMTKKEALQWIITAGLGSGTNDRPNKQ